MKIRILTISHKVPHWLTEAYDDYAKRLPNSYALHLVEIPAEKRLANCDISKITLREGEKMLALIKPHHHVIALDVKGKEWSTEELAENLSLWQQQGAPIDLLIGGPEGLAASALQRANEHWSLSKLTFPHHLVRLILAEQIYRAYTLITHHPYHRS